MINIKNKQGGFIPFVIIAVVLVLGIGGGVYVVRKNNEKKAALEDNLDTQANANTDANANVNANLGLNAKGTLRSMWDLGKNVKCRFSSTEGEVASSGTIFVTADGRMSGDFTSVSGGTTTESHMIVKDGTSYTWSGSQGAKMSTTNLNTNANAQAKGSVDLNSQVDYSCEDWTVDTSEFNLPAGVTFVDISAMLKGNLSIPGMQ